MLCPHCNVDSIPAMERMLANPMRPSTCPRCGLGSSPRRVSVVWAVSTILLFAVVAFTPGSYYGAMVVALVVLVSATFLIVALLPLEPATEAEVRTAKQARLFTRIAGALLVVILFVKLVVTLHAGAA